MFYALDLFCGAGGMSEGVISAGFHIVFSNDISSDVVETYTKRHEMLGLIHNNNTYYHQGDVKKLTGEFIYNSIKSLKIPKPTKIDVIFGGPPCQGFSSVGSRNKDDPRNLLFREYLRLVSEVKPLYLVIENVLGLLTTKLDYEGKDGFIYNNTLVPDILNRELDIIGYTLLTPWVLNSSDFGIPQKRVRVFFIAHKKGLKPPTSPTPKLTKITLNDAIGDINNIKPITTYQQDSIRGRTPTIWGNTINSNTLHNHDIPLHNNIVRERYSLFREGESCKSLRVRLTSDGIDLRKFPFLLDFCFHKLKKDKDWVIERFLNPTLDKELLDVLLTKKMFRSRLDRNSPAPTVITIADDYISPYDDRTFTVREFARVQSFDDSFIFIGKRATGGSKRAFEIPQYTQVGNAVPPLLSKAVAYEIMKVLKN